MTTGYSGTPLYKKLGIKPGSRIRLVAEPDNYRELIGEAAGEAHLNEGTSQLDMVHIFTNSRAELEAELSIAIRSIKPDGIIWVSWYKKAAKLPTEITEDDVRDTALPLGLVDVKVCAVDDKWSGLKLVIRKENRL